MRADVIATLGVGGCDVVIMALAAWRNHEGVRRAAAFTALAYTVWTATSLALLLGLPDAFAWFVLRPLILVILALAANSQRSGGNDQGTLMVLIEGWSTVGGIFGLAWAGAHLQTVFPVQSAVSAPMVWLIVQVLLISLVAGLFNRSAPGHRGPPLVAYLAGLAVLCADVLGLVTGDAALAIPVWLGAGLFVAVSLWRSGGRLIMYRYLDVDQPRLVRVWQLPIAYVVGYALLPMHRDLVLELTTIGLAAGIFGQLILQSGRNERLWARLAERTRLYQEMLADSDDAILQIDDAAIVEFANPASYRLLSMPDGSLLGTDVRDHAHPADRGIGARAIQAMIAAGRPSTRVVIRYPAGGPATDPGRPDWGQQPSQWRWIEWTVNRRGDDSGWLMSGRDVSERIRLQHDLTEAAQTDTLTGLLNRGAFLAEVDARLGSAREGAGVLFIDLDKFKAVNDTLGHAKGDELLRRAASCLRQAAGAGDVVARLGGDEFAVLAASCEGADVAALAEAVLGAFNGFDEAAVGRPSVRASIGIAVGRSGTATELLRDADLAMYRAKLRGGSSAVRFEPWMSQRVLDHSRLRADLEQAVRDEALTIYLQPVVDLRSSNWAGFEALVRWPVGGQIWAPDQFLPVAEESGLIVPMGAWVLREALRQLADWGDERVSMAVNVSARQLVGTDLFDLVMAALGDTRTAPGRLTLEITEQAAVQDLGRAASRLNALRAEGVHVAIDDFGTGYSSMQYLSRLPVDILKIDRKFVSGLGRGAEDDVLVRSMIRLAHELGLDVIAEGVETRAQADALLANGCRLAQGFLFSPPRPFADLRRIRADLRVPLPRTSRPAAAPEAPPLTTPSAAGADTAP